MIKVGDKAPDFFLPHREGKNSALADFKGKWIVLYFYPKDNTPGCSREAAEFSTTFPEFRAMNAVVVGISPDSPQSHAKFAGKYNLKHMLLSDEKHDVLERYGVWQLKKMYGREFYGVVRSTFIISPEGTVSYIWRRVKVDGHVEEVKSKLKELQGE
jgi:peroxiredoxin Q/BCP